MAYIIIPVFFKSKKGDNQEWQRLKVNLTGKAAGGRCMQGQRKKAGKTTQVILRVVSFLYLQKIIPNINRGKLWEEKLLRAMERNILPEFVSNNLKNIYSNLHLKLISSARAEFSRCILTQSTQTTKLAYYLKLSREIDFIQDSGVKLFYQSSRQRKQLPRAVNSFGKV